MSLFACPLDSTASSVPNPSSPTSRPAPRLSEFIAYALHRTRLPLAVTHQALFLLKRLKSRFPAARGSSGHRLFISALMLASKSTCDDTYSNKSWTIVGQGLFSLREVNQMERELFGYLGFKVNVENEELSEFVDGLEHGRIHTSTVTPPASVTSPALATPDVIPSVVHSPMASDAPSFGSASSSQSSLPSTSPSSYHHQHRGSVSSTSSSSSSYRPPVAGPSLSSRASIAGYPGSSHAAAAAQAMANVSHLRPSTSHPASVSAPSLHSKDANRSSSSLSSYHHHPHHHHGFNSHIRERSRPYTMPTNHNVALNGGSSSSNGHHGYYAAPSPSGSMSSSSISSCGSLSAGSSSSMSSCATPSSTHEFSGHSTPDTPPTEFSNSPWNSHDEKSFEDDEVNDEYGSMEDDSRDSVDGAYESHFRYNLENAHHYHHSKDVADESQRQGINHQFQHGVSPYGNWQ